MKKMAIVAVLYSLLLTACKKPPEAERVEQTSNKDYYIALLFEKDGYRVYRFYDQSRARYFVIPEGRVEWDQPESHRSGKSTWTEHVPESSETVPSKDH